jgi:hypothetical protein
MQALRDLVEEENVDVANAIVDAVWFKIDTVEFVG